MKTARVNNWMTVGAAVLTTTVACYASADQPAQTTRPESKYSGTVVSINPRENTLRLKGFVFGKKFNVGNACACTLLGNRVGTAYDLHPGEKITVSYQNVNGVLVADGVQEQALRYEGMVKTIDPAAHTLSVRTHGTEHTFKIPDGCNFFLRDGKAGSPADIQPGNQVTVTYETPDGTPTAWQIEQTSSKFTGSLTAIDLEEKTLKAATMFDSRKFNVGDDCVVVINGKPDGRLQDLKVDQTLVVSYDEVDGVNVANRIAQVEAAQTNSVAASPAPTAGY